MIQNTISPLLDYFTDKNFLEFFFKGLGVFAAMLIAHYIDNVKPGKSDNFMLNLVLAFIRRILSKVDPAMIGRNLATKHNPTSLNAIRFPDNLNTKSGNGNNGENKHE